LRISGRPNAFTAGRQVCSRQFQAIQSVGGHDYLGGKRHGGIETPLGNVLADGGGTVGTKVRLSIRPECIRVGNSNADSGVSFGRARLHDFVFQGTHLRCQASIANDRELVLRLAADNMVTPETTVDLWVQSRDVVLINREGT
jgi:ABC-type Fe3+/spermidine/putrescine transport system ATPase subunit